MSARTITPKQATPSPTRPPRGLCHEVTRGPNWLMVRIDAAGLTTDAAGDLVAELWSICERHFTYRLCVEADALEELPPAVEAALTELAQQLIEQGGALRLSGVTDRCERRLHDSHSKLQAHHTRREAVLASDGHAAVVESR